MTAFYIKMRKTILAFLFILISGTIFSQVKSASISGKVLDENEKPLNNVSITILGKEKGTTSKDSGYFFIIVPAGKPIALIFSYVGYKTVQYNYRLLSGENEKVTIQLQPAGKVLEGVMVTGSQNRGEAGKIIIDPNKALFNPSPLGNIESLIKIFVGSNNELTSQYNVRGGSYDENLIYVNDFEVFRPYLVRSGQQEGLSFINPEMTAGVKFYNGGFSARYGDKMSSVLDITYKNQRRMGVLLTSVYWNKGFIWKAFQKMKNSLTLWVCATGLTKIYLAAKKQKETIFPRHLIYKHC